jgi:hypothetical protein
MHTSGFVALAVLALIIAVTILVFTTNGARRDISHGSAPPITLGR